MKTKVCTGCNKEKEASLDFFHKNSLGKFGLRSKCKKCINKNIPKKTEYEKKKRRSEMNKLWRLKNRPPKKKSNYKKCGTCRNTFLKNEENFYKRNCYHKKTNGKVLRYKTWRSDCISCFCEKTRNRNRNRYWSDVDRSRKNSREKYWKSPNKARQATARWRQKNRQLILEKDRKRVKELDDSWVASNLGLRLKDIPKDVLEARKTIVRLKRFLKDNNVKIK